MSEYITLLNAFMFVCVYYTALMSFLIWYTRNDGHDTW